MWVVKTRYTNLRYIPSLSLDPSGPIISLSSNIVTLLNYAIMLGLLLNLNTLNGLM
uniref:Uncharacterized protein n=1 Tax=Rhizophora mucronata TaxID=61149 RepID=A0A2P2QX61_RHIMU